MHGGRSLATFRRLFFRGSPAPQWSTNTALICEHSCKQHMSIMTEAAFQEQQNNTTFQWCEFLHEMHTKVRWLWAHYSLMCCNRKTFTSLTASSHCSKHSFQSWKSSLSLNSQQVLIMPSSGIPNKRTPVAPVTGTSSRTFQSKADSYAVENLFELQQKLFSELQFVH